MARNPKLDDDEILDRAMTAFWQGGWQATSIRDLEHVLDLKAPSIYRRFGTKEGLGVAVVDHYVDRVVRRRVDKLLGPGRDPIANIVAFLERSVTDAGDGGGLWGCLLTTAALEADQPGPELTAALQRGFAVIENGLQAEIARADALDRLRPGVTPDAALATVTLALQGLMALARGGGVSADLRRRARLTVAPLTAD